MGVTPFPRVSPPTTSSSTSVNTAPFATQEPFATMPPPMNLTMAPDATVSVALVGTTTVPYTTWTDSAAHVSSAANVPP